jgi:hypothetical protein
MVMASSSQQDLHIRRIRESLDQIGEWRKIPGASRTQGFQSWRDRTKHSLGVIFGPEHGYTTRFGNLYFRVERLVFYAGMPDWDADDERACLGDIYKAEQLLKDALEEVAVLPDAVSGLSPRAPAPREIPSVVVFNMLSQTTSVDVAQNIEASFNALDLDADTKRAAQKHLRSLGEEARGQQRWTVMGKSLDLLKGLGKDVYEKVALPLALELIKKQAGLSGP